MIAFCLISILMLSILAIYMAVKEQCEVELYCEQTTSKTDVPKDGDESR